MLLNKIPCLDKGHVALISASNNNRLLDDIRGEYLSHLPNVEKLMSTAAMTLVFKCPIFIQTHLSQFGFKIIHTRPSSDVEAYVPNVGEVGGSDLDTNRDIADDMFRTTEALFINPKAYQSDGCDRFISQLLMPISTYTTIIVHGPADTWKAFFSQSGLPAPIEAYRAAVEQIYKAEWNNA
jgi:hypothetical protein